MAEGGAASSQDQEDPQPISINERYIGCVPIGQGSYGLVYKGTDATAARPDDAMVAIKEVAIREKRYNYHLKALVRECLLVMKLKHENIMSCRDIFFNAYKDLLQKIWIVMPFMATDLRRILLGCSDGLPDKVVKKFLWQTLHGLQYLHSSKIVHRDMKPGNILASEPEHLLKICDFGQARAVLSTSGSLSVKGIGTTTYLSPEVLVENKTYDYKVDIWSTGIILQYMIDGHCEFRVSKATAMTQLKKILTTVGKSDDDDLSWIENVEFRGVAERLVPEEKSLSQLIPFANPQAVDLLTKMLRLKPAARISAQEALSHPFFHNEPNAPNGFSPFDHPEQFNVESKTTTEMLDLLKQEILIFNQIMKQPVQQRQNN